MAGSVKGAHWAWRGTHALQRGLSSSKQPSVLLRLLTLQDKPADTFLKKCPKNNALNIQVEV